MWSQENRLVNVHYCTSTANEVHALTMNDIYGKIQNKFENNFSFKKKKKREERLAEVSSVCIFSTN